MTELPIKKEQMIDFLKANFRIFMYEGKPYMYFPFYLELNEDSGSFIPHKIETIPEEVKELMDRKHSELPFYVRRNINVHVIKHESFFE